MKRYAPSYLLSQKKTIITAHSGCESTPPNSTEHILAAIASGAEMIEADVRQHGDLLYLFHDLPENPSACVTLRELFALIAPEAPMEMNLDVKTEGLIPAVMALAKEYGLTNRIVFTGACNQDRALANSLGAEMWRSMWDGDDVPDGIQANRQDKSPFLNVHYPMITPEYLRDLRAIGSDFSAWTVDNETDLRRMLMMGIANITTRKPVLALALRKEIQDL